MYSNFLNHYYLSNVQHAAALEQTRQHLTNIFLSKPAHSEVAVEDKLENATLEELDRVWLRQLNSCDDATTKF